MEVVLLGARSRYCQHVALDTVCLSFAISSILRILASLLMALVLSILCDRSVHVSLIDDVGAGLSCFGSSLGILGGSMNECSFLVRYLVGVVVMDLLKMSCCFWRSIKAFVRGVRFDYG